MRNKKYLITSLTSMLFSNCSQHVLLCTHGAIKNVFIRGNQYFRNTLPRIYNRFVNIYRNHKTTAERLMKLNVFPMTRVFVRFKGVPAPGRLLISVNKLARRCCARARARDT